MSVRFPIAIHLAILARIVSFASLRSPARPRPPRFPRRIDGPEDRRARALLGVVLLVLGFAVVFVSYAAVFGTIGSWLTQRQDLITRVLGAAVIVMGRAFLGFVPFLQCSAKLNLKPTVGLAGAPLLGIAFGLGWTPCFGPTLVAISALSLESRSAGRGGYSASPTASGLAYPSCSSRSASAGPPEPWLSCETISEP